MSSSVKPRNDYIDLCKFIAMFVVTWEHFSQGFSHRVFPDFMGGHWYGIAFSMPLFMVCSGWFLNFSKIRETPLSVYLKSKFIRLVVPAVSFYLVFCLLDLKIPNPYHAITFYWYLTCLFVCLSIIAIAVKYIKHDTCVLLLLPIVALVPFSDFLKINFMLPFLLGGVVLSRFMYNDIPKFLVGIATFLLTGYLLLFWNVDYSVYKAPFNSVKLDFSSLGLYVYRFGIGFSGSLCIVFIAKYLVRFMLFRKMARLGEYTLVMYTVSVICKYLIQGHSSWLIDKPIILESISLLATILLIAGSVGLTKLFEKNKYTSFLFLGQMK